MVEERIEEAEETPPPDEAEGEPPTPEAEAEETQPSDEAESEPPTPEAEEEE